MPSRGGGGAAATPPVRNTMVRYSLPTNADWTAAAPSNHTLVNSANIESLSSTGGVGTMEHPSGTNTDWNGGTQTGPGFTVNDGADAQHDGDFDIYGRFFLADTAASGIDYIGIIVYNSADLGDFVACRIGRNGGNYVANWNADGTGSTDAITQANIETDGVWLRLRSHGNLITAAYKVGGSFPTSKSGWTGLRILDKAFAVNAPITLKFGIIGMSTTGNQWTATFDNVDLHGAFTDPLFTTL